MRNKIVSIVLVTLMLMSSVVYANPVEGGDNSGVGSGGSTSAGGSTWNTNQSGYRISVVDSDQKIVATVIDFLYSEPMANFGSSEKNWYKNSRFTGLSSDKNNWNYIPFKTLKDTGQIKDVPKQPIYTESGKSKLYAGGDYFKEWFLNGEYGMDLTHIPRKPVYSSSDSNKVETGTSRPVSSSPNYKPSGSGDTGYVKNTDMSGGYRGSALSNSPSSRNSVITTSVSIVKDQGYKASADKVSSSLASKSVNWFHRDVKKLNGGSIDRLVRDIANAIVLNAEYYGRTTAEQNYILAMALNGFLGRTGTIANNNLGRVEISKGEVLSGFLSQTAKISPEYYIDEVMNSQVKGKYVFRFNSYGLSQISNKTGVNSSKDPLEVIQDNNFYVAVEPLFWFRPATYSNGGKGREYSNYVYGTVNNLADFYNSIGWSNAGFYESLTNSIGWSSMYMGKDWKDDKGNVLMRGVSLGGNVSKGKKTHAEIKKLINDNYAIATHVYRTSVEDMQVTGFPNWDTPSRAPDPKDLKVPSGYTKEYNIIKYYEEYEDDVLIHRYEPMYRASNPPKIEIVDEVYFKVDDWFISSQTVGSGAPDEYASAKSKYGSTRGGKTTSTVKLEENKKNEKTLFVKLVNNKKPVGATNGDIVLEESKISIQVDTSDTSIKGFGLRSVSLPSLKSALTYTMSNIANTDSTLEATTGGKFIPVLIGNSGTGGSLTPKYTTTIWRGNDVPTLSSYKVSSGDPIRGLIPRYGNNPVTDRGSNGVYNKRLAIDLSTSYSGTVLEDEAHLVSGLGGIQYNADVAVKVYRGSNSKVEGKETKSGELHLPINILGTSSNYSTGKMIQGDTRLQFYPYIRMTYQDSGDKTDKDTFVTSQWNSVLVPNDYAEAGWINPNEESSLGVVSTQWSLHAKAVTGAEEWNGINQVLPGGAIYTLGMLDETIVGMATWQTIMVGQERANLSASIPDNEYTLDRARGAHNSYVEGAKATLEELEIEQWVNGDYKATNAWTNNGRRVKVSSGVSLSPLGLGGNASTEDKYQLTSDGEIGGANQADLDVLGEAVNTETYFKVFSDTSGNVYLAKSIGDLAKLQTINGNNLDVTNVTVIKILDKKVKAEDVASNLTGEARQLNDRTLLVTNFVKALERNTGNDKTASWATSDGKWYNEAWDGVYVVRQQTNVKVGFSEPKTRTLALDPNLTPKASGKADLFTNAYLSQYKTSNSSSSVEASTKGPGYLGTFKGEDVRLMNMGDMYKSKKFYIPNALVTDSY